MLYGVLFAERPQDRAASVAANLGHLDPAAIVSEIRLELGRPSQPIRAILPGMRASEADLREFLALVADELDRIAQRPGGG
ncbi:MAG: hypothetical protein L0Y54_06975 [Sporichthyaceae bacterium]|nr:hypothetical protein [Sporichthyaceae bacterium]